MLCEFKIQKKRFHPFFFKKMLLDTHKKKKKKKRLKYFW